MNRRKFLQSFAAVPVVAAVGVELAELLAPKRTIFLPPMGGWGRIEKRGVTYAGLFRENGTEVDGGAYERAELDQVTAAGFRANFAAPTTDWGAIAFLVLFKDGQPLADARLCGIRPLIHKEIQAQIVVHV